jgi:hypothetical protein
VLGRAEDYVLRFAFSSASVRTPWLAEQPGHADAVREALLAGEALIRDQPVRAAGVAADGHASTMSWRCTVSAE